MRKREDRKIPNFKKDSFEYNTKFEELAKKFGDEEKQNFPQKTLNSSVEAKEQKHFLLKYKLLTIFVKNLVCR